jgi:uncharacterized protein YwqG
MRRGALGNRKNDGGLMKKKYILDFVKADSPIREAVTKFGGQPVWIEKSEWAVSRSTGKPMRFIAQIRLDEELFGQTGSKMAYLFVNDETGENGEFISNTYDPNGGENGVIIQPDGSNPKSIELENGPTLQEWKVPEGETRRRAFDCEYAVQKSPIVEEEKPVYEEISDDEDFMPEYENKVGGYPLFLQDEEYPNSRKNNWNLLLQLDSTSVPFELNFGDSGIGYAYLSKDGKTGKFLWQCS